MNKAIFATSCVYTIMPDTSLESLSEVFITYNMQRNPGNKLGYILLCIHLYNVLHSFTVALVNMPYCSIPVVSCGLIEADYGGSLKTLSGTISHTRGRPEQTAHAQYRYKSNDIIMT